MDEKTTIRRYGYDDGKRGLEAEYCVNAGTLYIKIDGSNHWTDYVGNLAAWPRIPGILGKVHPFWAYLATGLASDIVDKIPDAFSRRNVHVAGHSMGGAVAAILPAFLSWQHFAIWTVNAPKAGDSVFTEWLMTNTEFVAWYDDGDIVRHLPLFYSRYPNQRCYEVTRKFWKAHNVKPEWWTSFPDKVVKS